MKAQAFCREGRGTRRAGSTRSSGTSTCSRGLGRQQLANRGASNGVRGAQRAELQELPAPGSRRCPSAHQLLSRASQVAAASLVLIAPNCDFLAARGRRDSAQRGHEQSPAWHQACGPLPTNFVGDPEISPQGTAKETLAQCFQNIWQITKVTPIYPPANPLAPRTINHPDLSVSPGLGRTPRSRAHPCSCGPLSTPRPWRSF